MRKRTVILLTVCSLVTTAIGGMITYYDMQAEHSIVVVSDRNE